VPTHSGGVIQLFGKTGAELVRANSPAEYAPSLAVDPATRVWMDSGSSDHQVLGQMRSLAPVLRGRGMVVVEKVRPGQHTFSVWRAALKDSLSWALTQRPGQQSLTVGAQPK
jgi:enterochelin esterase-like enzyme